MALKNVDAIKSKWKPPKAITSSYPLLWGSSFFPREGSKKIGRGKAIVIDILHTDDRAKGGKIRFTQQHIGEIITAPAGVYRIDLEIIVSHLGREFRIPVSFTVGFTGGMNIEYIKPSKQHFDKRIREVVFEKDGTVINGKKDLQT